MSATTKPPKAPKAPKQPKQPKAPKPPKAEKAPKTEKAPKGAKPQGAKATSGRRSTSGSEPAAVNLLSPWVLDELHVLQLRRRFALGLLVLVLVLGLGWAGLKLELHRSEEEVRGEEAVSRGLQDQINGLSDVRSYVTGVDRRAKTVTAVTAAETQFSRALSALGDALPRSASLDSLTVALPVGAEESGDAAAAACPGPDPFGAKAVIACLEISGTADSRADVSTFVQRLSRNRLFVEPFVATTTKGTEKGVAFTGSVGLTPEALSDPAAAAKADDAEAAPAPEAEGGS